MVKGFGSEGNPSLITLIIRRTRTQIFGRGWDSKHEGEALDSNTTSVETLLPTGRFKSLG